MEVGGVNLVALTTYGRSSIHDGLIGSAAKRILEIALGDVLLLRDPRTLGPTEQPCGVIAHHFNRCATSRWTMAGFGSVTAPHS